MMNTKLTQSYRTNPGQSENLKRDNVNTMSAAEKEAMGGDLGDKLNQLADANWVDPKKLRKVGNEKLDKDAFLTLMLTQMKNQDPTNPLKSHEMAAQLAQFTSLEQMQNVNTKLDDLIKIQKPSAQFQALDLIGKAVESDSSQFHRADGDKSHGIRFRIDKNAQEVVVKITDEKGDRVKEYTLNDLKKGENSVTWNGFNYQDQNMRPGKYNVSIEAKDANGSKVSTSTKIAGTISGVNYTPNGPVMLVGNQSIALSEIKKIVDPKVQPAQSREVKDVTKQALKNEAEKKDNKESAKAAPVSAQTGNIDSIPMSRQFQRQLKNTEG